MPHPTSIPRPLAEHLLRRAVLLDEQASEAASHEDGYQMDQLRAAAQETGVDPIYVEQAAQDVLANQDKRSRWTLLGYSGATGIVAAVAAVGLLRTGHPRMAVIFILLDLILLVSIIGGLGEHFVDAAQRLREMLGVGTPEDEPPPPGDTPSDPRG